MMKQQVSRTLTWVLAVLVTRLGAVSADQLKGVTPPGISSPHAEPALDPFAVAVRSHSTSPFFVLVTIVDDRTGTARKVCTEAPFLVGAMITQLNLNDKKDGEVQAARRIIANSTRTYHLSNPRALANVAPRYTKAQLATVRERLQGYSREQLIKLFSTDRSDGAYMKPGEPWDSLQYAAAFILEEHGLSVRMADISGHIFAFTTEDLVRQKLKAELQVAAWKEADRKAMALAKGVVGYASLAGAFTIIGATTADINGGLSSLRCDLNRRTRSLVDEATWYNPISLSGPQYPWAVFLQRYTRATAVASRLRWLNTWKRWTDGTVSYECFGATGVASEFDLPDVQKAWRRAGLPGNPEYELTLSTGRESRGTIYLDARSKKVLVYNLGNVDITDPKYDVSGVRAIPLPGGLVPQRPADQRRLGVTFHTIAGLADYYVAVPVRRAR